MKKILIFSIALLFVTLVSVSVVGTPKAQAFEIDLPNICDIVPQLCDESPSITPSVEPSVEPTVEVTVEPSIDPSITPVETVTPTNAPSNNTTVENHGDGKSDGRSDGLCSKPPCVSGNNIPAGPPATGRGL